MEQWYALYTAPRQEAHAREALGAKGVTTYLPVWQPRRGRRRHRGPEALFPCYLFARVDLSSVGLSHVQWTPGVRSIVSFGGEPAVVHDEIVSALRELEAQGGTAWRNHDLKPGVRVRIASGPLKGLEGIFADGLSSSARARVFIGLLGRMTACQVGVDALERVL